MMSNSWLYHYYSVQSKIQFGLPFEGSSRSAAPTSLYHHTNILPNMTHTYHSSHHAPYGYHPPVDLQSLHNAESHQQSSPATNLISHHQHDFTYKRDTQPVDYSQNSSTPSNECHQINECHPINIRCSSTNSSSSSSAPSQSSVTNCRINSPPMLRKRILGKLKPLFIIENSNESPESSVDIEAQCRRGEIGSATYETVLQTRHRFLTKAPPPEPPDFWNPSPPWSDGTQRVPDLSSNSELSPTYVVTTPPTPSSAPTVPSISGSTAFSFDLITVGEQFVPIIDTCGVPYLTTESLQLPLRSVAHQWSQDHRLIASQTSPITLTPPNSNEPINKRLRRNSDKKGKFDVHIFNLFFFFQFINIYKIIICMSVLLIQIHTVAPKSQGIFLKVRCHNVGERFTLCF